MRRIHLWTGVMTCVVAVAAGCSKKQDTAPPVAVPSVTLSRADAPIGSPVDVTYKFTIPASAPALTEDYTVFVHFVDKDGELMWTDDHTPTPPTRAWKAGSTIQYTRTVFIPRFPYLGEAHVDIGVYSPKTQQRLPLAGQDAGMRAYRVATFQMKPQADDTFVVFKDGWHDTEVGEPNSGQEWQWSRKMATLSFRNPKRNAELLIDCDQPVTALGAPQHVTMQIGSAMVDSFDLVPGHHELRRVALTPDQLGTGDSVDLVISVDRTFVPSSIPQLKSSDARELGVRVFRAYLQPK